MSAWGFPMSLWVGVACVLLTKCLGTPFIFIPTLEVSCFLGWLLSPKACFSLRLEIQWATHTGGWVVPVPQTLVDHSHSFKSRCLSNSYSVQHLTSFSGKWCWLQWVKDLGSETPKRCRISTWEGLSSFCLSQNRPLLPCRPSELFLLMWYVWRGISDVRMLEMR